MALCCEIVDLLGLYVSAQSTGVFEIIMQGSALHKWPLQGASIVRA